MDKESKRLQQYLKNTLEAYPNIHQMAVSNGWSYGLVYRCLNGGYSPSLARKIGISKHPRRSRLTAACSQEMIDRFDSQRGELSRREYLIELLDMADGVGEVV